MNIFHYRFITCYLISFSCVALASTSQMHVPDRAEPDRAEVDSLSNASNNTHDGVALASENAVNDFDFEECLESWHRLSPNSPANKDDDTFPSVPLAASALQMHVPDGAKVNSLANALLHDSKKIHFSNESERSILMQKNRAEQKRNWTKNFQDGLGTLGNVTDAKTDRMNNWLDDVDAARLSLDHTRLKQAKQHVVLNNDTSTTECTCDCVIQ